MNIPKVYNMTSDRSNREVANQFIINTTEGDYFQSYRSIIAFKPIEGKIKLASGFWDYSRTTSKYLCSFLHEDTKTIRQKIKSGEYEVVDLN